MSLWKRMMGSVSSATAAEVRLDTGTYAMNCLDYEHHEIHAGSFYSIHVTDDALASGSYIDLLLTTPNTTKWAHMLPYAESNGAMHLFIYENPTVTGTAAGTIVTGRNHDRNSTNTGTLMVRVGSSATNVGAELIAEWHVGATGTITQAGGNVRTIGEFILKQNEDYLFRVESHDTTISVSQVLSWYEHTNQQ